MRIYRILKIAIETIPYRLSNVVVVRVRPRSWRVAKHDARGHLERPQLLGKHHTEVSNRLFRRPPVFPNKTKSRYVQYSFKTLPPFEQY